MTPVVVPDEISAYTEAHTTPPPQHLRRLAEDTRAALASPQMLTGTVEGRLLELLVFASGARRILELGTYSGYSALSMAAALPPDGRIVTCELDPDTAAFARERFDSTPYGDRIEIRVGPALEALGSLEGPFDLVFVDAHKPEYPEYYERALPLLADRGLLVIDNTLWSGRVLEGEDDGTPQTAAIRELNDRIAADERVIAVMLPVRDGVTIVRRA